MINDTPINVPAETPDSPSLWRPSDMAFLRAAQALRGMLPHPFDTMTRDDVALELTAQMLDPDARDLDALLVVQARLLDAVFAESVQNGITRKSYDAECIDVALKAQRQCNATIASIRRMQSQRKAAERTEAKNAANELKDRLK